MLAAMNVLDAPPSNENINFNHYTTTLKKINNLGGFNFVIRLQLLSLRRQKYCETYR